MADAGKNEIEAALRQLIATYGPFTYDLPLPHGVWTRDNQGPPHMRLKRIVRLAADLSLKPLAECRVLDLGCLEGLFAIEFGLHGAEVLGIEIREANIRKAEFTRDLLGRERVTFQ